MFDIGFTELALCFLVALVILGPEKLPRMARTIGRWMGQARGYMRNLSTELERETQVSDIKRQLEEARSALREAGDSIEREGRNLAKDISSKDTSSDIGRKP